MIYISDNASHIYMQKGALVNNTRQSNDGVDPMVFKNVQVYSGHYHRPHVVPNTNIQYVGSSYHGKSPSPRGITAL